MIDPSEREEIEMLLPWYEKGTLGAAEMRRVEAHLAAHPELEAQLVLIREEVAETVAANETLGMPKSSARDGLMTQIEAEAGAGAAASGGYLAWLRNWLPIDLSPGLAVAGAVAALVIIVQAGVLVSLLSERGAAYRIASGDKAQPATAGTFVLIRFADGATAGQIAALLKSVDGAIVDGPKPGGVFKIRLSPRVLSDAEREVAMNILRQRTDVVTFLAPAG